MLNFTHRSLTKELLDFDDIPFDDIKQNLKELNFINTYLGGHAITLQGVHRIMQSNKSLIIAEIGCGGGDNLVEIGKYLSSKKVKYKLIGIDIKKECIEYGKSQNNTIQFICSDYKNVIFDEKPTIIFSSLFCHHFSDEELIIQIKWMQKQSTLGFFINDLHRNAMAYFLIKLLTQLFSRSYLVKNDAPLSVSRGFKKNEWYRIFEKAGIQNFSVKWQWAFRHLIIYRNESH